jgi:hypothetical protein
MQSILYQRDESGRSFIVTKGTAFKIASPFFSSRFSGQISPVFLGSTTLLPSETASLLPGGQARTLFGLPACERKHLLQDLARGAFRLF